jgi:hypothetical protein
LSERYGNAELEKCKPLVSGIGRICKGFPGNQLVSSKIDCALLEVLLEVFEVLS